jgi:hypothetical protein
VLRLLPGLRSARVARFRFVSGVRFPRRLPGWFPVRGCDGACSSRPSVRPAVRVRALRADAREVQDGTVLGTITHGARSWFATRH